MLLESTFLSLLIVSKALAVESFRNSIELTASRQDDRFLNQSPLGPFSSLMDGMTQSSTNYPPTEIAEEPEMLTIVIEEPIGNDVVSIPVESSSQKHLKSNRVNLAKNKIHIEGAEATNAEASACAICLEDFESGDSIASPSKKLVCGHYFHNSCIEQWFKQEATCPLCRKDLPHIAGHNLMNSPDVTRLDPLANSTPGERSNNQVSMAEVRFNDHCVHIVLNSVGCLFSLLIVITVIVTFVVKIVYKT